MPVAWKMDAMSASVRRATTSSRSQRGGVGLGTRRVMVTLLRPCTKQTAEAVGCLGRLRDTQLEGNVLIVVVLVSRRRRHSPRRAWRRLGRLRRNVGLELADVRLLLELAFLVVAGIVSEDRHHIAIAQ